MQERYIEHCILYCIDEQIIVVTSFCSSLSFLQDDTQLITVRPISDISRLYYEFFEYQEIIVINRLNRAVEDLLE